MNHFEQGMQKNDANFVPLTPLSFLDRIKDVYPQYEALIYGSRHYTWKQVYERCTRFASALTKIGVGEGDVVSVMAGEYPRAF
jgi:fatty-acyl-CoA synthase